ncbi:MAG: FHA domain-containing protein [Bacteroidota bacterium]
MATIVNTDSKEQRILFKHHTVGRERHNRLVLAENDVSRSHAAFYWDGQHWHLKDQSRNGTLVNGKYIKDHSVPLALEDTLQFGQYAGAQWKVTGLEPPTSFLQALDSPNLVIQLATELLYPDEENPIASFYQNPDRQWMADLGEAPQLLKHEETYTLAGKTWRFIENDPMQVTENNSQIRDEAEVLLSPVPKSDQWMLTIVIRNITLDLQIRAHHRILALLAEQLENQPEDPWMGIEDMVAVLDPDGFLEWDEYYINTQVHRFRKQVMNLAPYGFLFSDLIDRKKGFMRINHPNVRLVEDQ